MSMHPVDRNYAFIYLYPLPHFPSSKRFFLVSFVSRVFLYVFYFIRVDGMCHCFLIAIIFQSYFVWRAKRISL